MLCQGYDIYRGIVEDFGYIYPLVKKNQARIGKWWNKEAVKEVLNSQKNRTAIVVLDSSGVLKGFIFLQLWGSKGEWKGRCKSLVTISTEPGVGTLLQSLLPLGTVGYVSERNTAQNKVMEKSGYTLVDKKLYKGRGMNIWIKEQNPQSSLQNAQKSLNEKLCSMARLKT